MIPKVVPCMEVDVSRRIRVMGMAGVVLTLAAGCGPAPAPAVKTPPAATVDHDHDAGGEQGHDDDTHAHDDHAHTEPHSLGEGVAQLVRAADAVKDHLAADARDAADDAVHTLGHLLEDLQGLVRTSGLAAETKAKATQALDDLFECFDTLDTALHGEPGTGPTPADAHASIANRVEEAIETLRGCVTAEPPGEDRR